MITESSADFEMRKILSRLGPRRAPAPDLLRVSGSTAARATRIFTLQGVARFVARPANQSRHPRAGSDGRTQASKLTCPLRHRRGRRTLRVRPHPTRAPPGRGVLNLSLELRLVVYKRTRARTGGNPAVAAANQTQCGASVTVTLALALTVRRSISTPVTVTARLHQQSRSWLLLAIIGFYWTPIIANNRVQ